MKTVKVKDVMTCEPELIRPTDSVKEAARRMKGVDCGVLPVGESADKVIGMITDRDITIRVTAEGKDPAKTQVREVMTGKVYSCDEDDDIEEAAEKMRRHDVCRLVVNKGKRATGIVTQAELLRAHGDLKKGDQVLHELVGCTKKRAMGGNGYD